MIENQESNIVEIAIYGRGGQGAITASSLLCEIAFEEGYKDVLDIPMIGAERRGAPVQAYAKLSKLYEIKNFCSVTNQQYSLIFDHTLLKLKNIVSTFRGIIIINAPKRINLESLNQFKEVWIVDATNISIKHNLLIAGFPILNTLMLGAFARVSNQFSLESLKKVLYERFGKTNGERNYIASKEAYDSVKRI